MATSFPLAFSAEPSHLLGHPLKKFQRNKLLEYSFL